MEDEYYSLESILADNHKLSCTFTLDVPGLGYLEGGTEADIHQHQKLELPFWLAQTLSLNEFTTFPLPPAYSPRVRSALNASASSVRLSNLVGGNGWWYRWGRRIADVLDDQPQADLLAMLLRALVNRLPSLQDLAAHHASSDQSVADQSGGGGDGFKEGLEGDEREYDALTEYTAWADGVVCAAGQDSGRLVKIWYDSSWGQKRR